MLVNIRTHWWLFIDQKFEIGVKKKDGTQKICNYGHPGNLGEAIDPWLYSFNIQPITLLASDHVTPRSSNAGDSTVRIISRPVAQLWQLIVTPMMALRWVCFHLTCHWVCEGTRCWCYCTSPEFHRIIKCFVKCTTPWCIYLWFYHKKRAQDSHLTKEI